MDSNGIENNYIHVLPKNVEPEDMAHLHVAWRTSQPTPGLTTCNRLHIEGCTSDMIPMLPETAEAYELKHVHHVYEKIAVHFSSTRYKPWPTVAKFLKGMSPGSIGLDVGCGNGKYMTVNPDVFIVGSDRSFNLTSISNGASVNRPDYTSLVADAHHLPHPDLRFDFAISIAVVHHFATKERRIDALKAIIACLRTGGKALVVVWALEQESSPRWWTKDSNADVFVPWTLTSHLPKGEKFSNGESETNVYNRYYHLFKEGELEASIAAANGFVLESGYERDNWWAIFSPKTIEILSQ